MQPRSFTLCSAGRRAAAWLRACVACSARISAGHWQRSFVTFRPPQCLTGVNLLTSVCPVDGPMFYSLTSEYLTVPSSHCFLTHILQLPKLTFICPAVLTSTHLSLSLPSGRAEALYRGDHARQERHLQSLHVWLLPGRGDGSPEGAVSRQPAALGTDPPIWRGSGSQWRPDGRHLQVSLSSRRDRVWRQHRSLIGNQMSVFTVGE